MLLSDYLAKTKQTPAAFADLLGVSRSIVSAWISRDRFPSLTNIEQIETATGGKVTRRDLRPDWFPKRAA